MCFNIYITDDNGRIKFTKQGIEHLKPLFQLAGIDIRSVHTKQQYQKARQQSSPFFIQYITERAEHWPDTDQFKLLKSAVFCDDDSFEIEISRFENKSKLQILK